MKSSNSTNNRFDRRKAILSRVPSFITPKAKLYKSTSHPGHFIIPPHKTSKPLDTSLIIHDTGRVVCPDNLEECPLRVIGVRLAREVHTDDSGTLVIPKASKSLTRQNLNNENLPEEDKIILTLLNWIDIQIKNNNYQEIKTEFVPRKKSHMKPNEIDEA